MGETENIQVPNNTLELNAVNDYVENLNNILTNYKVTKTLSTKDFKTLYQDILKILFHVGDLSKPIFEIRDELEDSIFKKNKNTPKLNNKLFWSEYSKYHKPYTSLKNKCYNMLDELEVLYEEVYSHEPIYFY